MVGCMEEVREEDEEEGGGEREREEQEDTRAGISSNRSRFFKRREEPTSWCGQHRRLLHRQRVRWDQRLPSGTNRR